MYALLRLIGTCILSIYTGIFMFIYYKFYYILFYFMEVNNCMTEVTVYTTLSCIINSYATS